MIQTLEHATDADLVRLLESDYRRQLRWYPRAWREANGDALIGTVLDEADADDRFTMEPGEWRLFAVAGLASRLDRLIARRVRDSTSTVLLSAGAGISVVCFVVSSWAPWSSGAIEGERAFGPFSDAGPLLTALWTIALICGAVGRWWVGRIALLLSVLVAVLMHPVETLLAPSSFVSLDPGTLGLSVAAATLAVLGTPRTRGPLLAATVGWAGVACAGWGYELLTSDGPVGRPTVVLVEDPARTAWAITLALGVALVLVLGRYRAAGATVVLVSVPVAVAVVASRIAFDAPADWGAPLLVVVPLLLGVVAVLVASRRAADARVGAAATGVRIPHRNRRSALAVGIAASAVVIGGTAGVLTASGLDWADPVGVDWSRYWQLEADRPWAPWAQHPDASVSYRLPSGGSCTIRIAITDLTTTTSPTTAAISARDYLHAGQAHGTLLADADVTRVLRSDPSARNQATSFWGVPMRYGRGTISYNPDAEYFEAVDDALRGAVLDQVARSGGDPDDILYSSMQRCTGGTV